MYGRRINHVILKRLPCTCVIAAAPVYLKELVERG
jgi:hypothetical protein